MMQDAAVIRTRSVERDAFALPGGKVGVYTGLIQLAESDAELAIVMGHEIGHVIARHGAERMSEAAVIAGIGMMGAAIVDAKTEDPQARQLFELAYGAGTTLGRVLPHSRGNESEADRMGAIYAARAGYDPRAGITLWEKMSAKAKGAPPQWLSTHPAGSTRIHGIEKNLPKVTPLYERAPKAPT